MPHVTHLAGAMQSFVRGNGIKCTAMTVTIGTDVFF